MLNPAVEILLVEDNRGDARLIELLLAEEAGNDFHITHVSRLADAITALGSKSFAVVLLDLSLPDSHGLETVTKMRDHAGQAPIVVLSGLDDEDMALRALQSGAMDYLVKGRADGNLIKRAILYAQERQRTRQRVLLAEAAFSATDTGIIVLGADRHIIRVNPAFTRLTGYAQQEVEGREPLMLGSGEEEEGACSRIWSGLDPAAGWEGEVWNRRPNGDLYPVWLRINGVYDDAGALNGFVVVLSDITHRKKAEAELVRQATRDPLTGLPNRALFVSLLEEAVVRATAHNASAGCGLLFVDLDGFKGVNDTLGHDAGDQVLREVARRLRAALRASDEVARLAGDEFVVILADVRSPDDAARVAEKIVSLLADPYVLPQCDLPAHLSASVGIALCPQDAQTGETLLKAADGAMYEAKHMGKNRWFHPKV